MWQRYPRELMMLGLAPGQPAVLPGSARVSPWAHALPVPHVLEYYDSGDLQSVLVAIGPAAITPPGAPLHMGPVRSTYEVSVHPNQPTRIESLLFDNPTVIVEAMSLWDIGSPQTAPWWSISTSDRLRSSAHFSPPLLPYPKDGHWRVDLLSDPIQIGQRFTVHFSSIQDTVLTPVVRMVGHMTV
jgi:hypothetical protein